MGLILAVSAFSCGKNEDIYVGNFRAGQLNGWEAKSFKGKTDYLLVEKGKRTVLEAFSRAAASGLIKPVEINLERYPFFNWSWMATSVLEGNDERSKQGDDFPVRLFVVISGAALFGDPLALNYVWSRNQPVGSSWPNPFTANSTMLVVESGRARLKQWVSYKRNIREDLKRHLGVDAERTLAVALMVDTDNTGQQARSYFGDIFFSAN